MPSNLSVETRGTGPIVLFVHGLDSDASVWSGVIDLLPDHQCVTVDLPGHGDSPVSEDPSAYERAALLAHLDEILANLDAPPMLVGHSLGGYLGMAFALTRPTALAGMALVSTGPGFRDPDARENWNRQVRDSAADYSIPDIAAAVAYHEDSMVIDRMQELTLPLALVIGDEDRAYIGANDYMEKKLPHAARTTIAGGRHYVMKSHPEAVADAIRSLTSTPGA